MCGNMKYELIRSGRKTLAIEITSEGKVLVRAPMHIRQKMIEQFLVEKQKWITKHLEHMKKTAQTNPVFHFRDGEKHLYFGEQYPITTGLLTSKQFLFDGSFIFDTSIPIEKRPLVLSRWYTLQIHRYAQRRLPELAPQMQVTYSDHRISKAKTYWGVCNKKNTIGINWRLAMAPHAVIDAILVHELAHTKHKHHKKPFWEFVIQYAPHYKKADLWLKSHQSHLGLFP